MLGGAGEEIELGHPLDWKEALRLTLGDGLSDPASEEEVVWLEELRDSTLQDDMSKDLGREVFMRTRRSNVDTLKSKKEYFSLISFQKFELSEFCLQNGASFGKSQLLKTELRLFVIFFKHCHILKVQYYQNGNS